ncbi:MAG: hypothetical protein EHM20_06125, partial [Alphaproteobacteria bacterium]
MVFTHTSKNEILRIILLMEQQFKKLLQKTKAQKEQKDPLFKSFEGALFQDSSWFFHFQDQVVEMVPGTFSPVNEEQKVPGTFVGTYLCEVLFVGDTYNGEGDDLLGKMISAMKLTGSEFVRFKMDEELDDVNDLANNLESPTPASQKLLDIILE